MPDLDIFFIFFSSCFFADYGSGLVNLNANPQEMRVLRIWNFFLLIRLKLYKKRQIWAFVRKKKSRSDRIDFFSYTFLLTEICSISWSFRRNSFFFCEAFLTLSLTLEIEEREI